MRKILFPGDLVCSNEHTNGPRDKISLVSLSCIWLVSSHIATLTSLKFCFFAKLMKAACWARLGWLASETCLKICSYSLAVYCLSYAVKWSSGSPRIHLGKSSFLFFCNLRSLPVNTVFWSQGTGSLRLVLWVVFLWGSYFFDPN